MTKYQIKRAYEPASPDDGFRVYIDRLWPQGLSHETFHYNLWDKEIAPTTDLRKWFHEDPQDRWTEFEKKYLEYLKNSPAFADLKNLLATKDKVTLLYSSRNEDQNNAIVVLKALTA